MIICYNAYERLRLSFKSVSILVDTAAIDLAVSKLNRKRMYRPISLTDFCLIKYQGDSAGQPDISKMYHSSSNVVHVV